MRFIGVFNRDGGTFRTLDLEAFARRAVEIFGAHGHMLEPRIVAGRDLLAALREAADSTDVLLAGGGDGTLSAAAAIAFRKDIPLAVLPAGTMNLFARSLHLPLDLDAAVEAIAAGSIAPVDIATANGRPFVHQYSVGLHAKLVKLRDTLDYHGRWGKIAASFRAFVGVMFRPPNFTVEIVTERGLARRRTSGVSVSNNPFAEGHAPHPDRLDAGVLGVYVASPVSTVRLVRLTTGVMIGRWRHMPEVAEDRAKVAVLRFPRRKASAVAVIDGELVALPDKVEITIHPGALQVVVPASAPPAETVGAEQMATL